MPDLRNGVGEGESGGPIARERVAAYLHCELDNTYKEVPMTTTNRTGSPGGARKRTQATAGPAAHRPARQVSQPDPAVSATPQRGAEGAAWTQPVAIPGAAALLSTVAGTVTQGQVVAREAGRLARELLRISLGSSSVAPAKGDWRFADPAWTQNPVYRRIGQAYLASQTRRGSRSPC